MAIRQIWTYPEEKVRRDVFCMSAMVKMTTCLWPDGRVLGLRLSHDRPAKHHKDGSADADPRGGNAGPLALCSGQQCLVATVADLL